MRRRKKNEVVELGGRIISHLNHTLRRRNAVLFHRYVLRCWRKGWERGAAKGGEIFPCRGYIFSASSFLPSFPSFSSQNLARANAFSPL